MMERRTGQQLRVLKVDEGRMKKQKADYIPFNRLNRLEPTLHAE
jgi:hypothetical protein